MNQKRDDIEFDKPSPLWFFRRGDGFEFPAKAGEAWNLIRNKSNWQRQDIVCIGYSDGKTYFDYVNKHIGKQADIKEELASLEKNLRRYQQTEERLVFEELLDDDHEKVVAVRKKIEELDKQIDEKTELVNNYVRTVKTKAFQLELEVAKENAKNGIPSPENQDVFTPGASPSDRQKLLNYIK